METKMRISWNYLWVNEGRKCSVDAQICFGHIMTQKHQSIVPTAGMFPLFYLLISQDVYLNGGTAPDQLSGGSWQTSPAECCVHPALLQKLSTPAPTGLRSAGSAGKRSGPTPGADFQLTWSGWCSRTHSAFQNGGKERVVASVLKQTKKK